MSKVKYRGYAYVKGIEGGGGVDPEKVKEIINSYIVQETGDSVESLMSQKAVTDAINDADVGDLKTRVTTAENNIKNNTTNIETNLKNIAINTADIETNKQNITLENTARVSADNTLQTNINNEESARIAQDTTLQTNIDSEAQARTDKDTELLGKININKGNIDIVNNGLTTLKESFNTHLKEYEENVRTINSTIANETIARQNKDSELENKITSLEGDIKIEVVDSEPPTPENNTIYFIKTNTGYSRKLYNNDQWYDMGDTEIDLSNYYTKEETYSKDNIDTLLKNATDDIATEKITRSDADTTLLNNINSEIESREARDTTLQTNIDNEKTARETADSNLQTQITTNNTNITNEITNRETADSNLQTQITTNTTDINSLKTDKQDLLTASTGINIDSVKNISINLNAGDGISIDSNNVSAKIKKIKTGVNEEEQTLTGDGTITMPHLYMHTFSFGQSNYMLIGTTMFNNSETAIGKSGLINWLTTNGYTSLINVYPLTTGVTGVNTYYVATSSGGSTTTRSFISVAATGLYADGSALKCKSNFNGNLTLDDTYYGLIEEKIIKIY